MGTDSYNGHGFNSGARIQEMGTDSSHGHGFKSWALKQVMDMDSSHEAEAANAGYARDIRTSTLEFQ